MVLISCPHTNAERMSKCDGAASLLAAGVHAADEGAGCLKGRVVVDEEVNVRDIPKLGGVGFCRSARPWACVYAVWSLGSDENEVPEGTGWRR